MAPLPAVLYPYWDLTDNFDGARNLMTPVPLDVPNNFMASWNCPTCDDYWKASVSSMKQRIRGHASQYGTIYPCKFCNPHSDRGNWDAYGAKRCHIDSRDSVEELYPLIAAQWASITIDDTVYSLNDVQPDEIVAGKEDIFLRCDKPVDAYGNMQEGATEQCRHLRYVRIRSACNPGGVREPHDCGSCTYGGTGVNNFDRRNSLLMTNLRVAMELLEHPNGLSADEIRPGSDKYCRWRCEQTTYGSKCHHEWDAQIVKRTGNSVPGYRSGCPACINDVVHEDGRNSLATLFPFVSQDWNHDLNDLTPEQVCPGWSSDKIGQVFWRCAQLNEEGSPCAHEWSTSLYSRTQMLRNLGHLPLRFCPSCNPGSGFNNARVGYYYALRIIGPDQSIVKNGITNVPLSRMTRLSHSLNQECPDWNYTIESIHRHPPSPLTRQVQTLESSLLREQEIRVPHMNFDGGHELFTVDAFSYAEANSMLESDDWEDVTDEMQDELNHILHRFNAV